MGNQTEGREDKKKKKKAREALLLFLKRLRKACKIFKTADEWYSFLKELETLLQDYEKQIPPVHLQRIKNAMRLIDSTRAGIKKACKILEFEIEDTLKAMHTGGGLGKALVGGLIVIAAIVGAAVAYLNFTSVEVGIWNNGCDTLYMPAALPVSIPGIELPDGPIPPGGHGTARVPRMTVHVDATQPGTIVVTVLGLPVSIHVGGDVTGIELDGMQILGQSIPVKIGGRAQHELVISCH